MNKALTLQEIKEQYDKEWVLIDEPEEDETFEIKSGVVLYHNKNRYEFDRDVLKFHPKRFAVVYIGEGIEGMAYVLCVTPL